jgi:hypothetical protein
MGMTAHPRPQRCQNRWAVVAAAAVLLAACGSTTSTSSSTGPPVTPAPGPTLPAASTTTTPTDGPPAIPAHGAYLGAWIHPVAAGGRGSSFAVEQRTLPAVRAVVGRPLGILAIYAPWKRSAPVTDLAAITDRGSIPLLSWGCAPNGPQVAGGADDRQITAYARALKAFAKPVLLRWCWEMNLVASHPEVGGPSGFVAAWDHLRKVFQQVGATNVSFVWCPAIGGVDPSPYYPGAANVDWIGVDGYDQSGASTFSDLFSGFYRQWVGQDRPMVVAETGATATDQAAYLRSIADGMPELPAFKALVYFDATGPSASWQLTPSGLAGLHALARNPYFDPT